MSLRHFVAAAVTAVLILFTAASSASATPVQGDNPAWVVSQYLQGRLHGAEVPAYPYVCPADVMWKLSNTASTEPPFFSKQNDFLDIKTFNPDTIRTMVERGELSGYAFVNVDVQGYERSEARTFELASTQQGYCIGNLQ
jgi:hypothetical protein